MDMLQLRQIEKKKYLSNLKYHCTIYVVREIYCKKTTSEDGYEKQKMA